MEDRRRLQVRDSIISSCVYVCVCGVVVVLYFCCLSRNRVQLEAEQTEKFLALERAEALEREVRIEFDVICFVYIPQPIYICVIYAEADSGSEVARDGGEVERCCCAWRAVHLPRPLDARNRCHRSSFVPVCLTATLFAD
jgi:hypothetical protein